MFIYCLLMLNRGVKIKCYQNKNVTPKYLTFKSLSCCLSVAVSSAALSVICLATVFAAFLSYCVVNMEGVSHGALLV